MVITIVILLILAGVLINITIGQNGLLTKAKNAADFFKREQAREKVEILLAESTIENRIEGKQLSTFLEEQKTKNAIEDCVVEGNTITVTVDGYDVTVDKENVKITDITLHVPIVYPEYEVGQEVALENSKGRREEFYVLESSDSTKRTVTLFAKYNLSKTDLLQAPDRMSYSTSTTFISSFDKTIEPQYLQPYWTTAFNGYSDWATKKLDLNKEEEYGFASSPGDAIYRAKEYAISLGGTNGRLLTYEEAEALKTLYPDMINGTANQQGPKEEYYLFYWLSSLRGPDDNDETINDQQYVFSVFRQRRGCGGLGML